MEGMEMEIQRTALDQTVGTVPRKVVKCPNVRCEAYNVEAEVDAGLLVSSRVYVPLQGYLCTFCNWGMMDVPG